MNKIAVVLGSDSDLPVMKVCVDTLRSFGVETTLRVISAHRTPMEAERFAKSARSEGYSAIIAAAGKAAHLAGVLAAHTALPVIGVPMKSSALDGLDALLSTVQMPGGIPVATVAIDGAQNAALLAIQIMATSDEALYDKLLAFKDGMAEDYARKDREIASKLEKL